MSLIIADHAWHSPPNANALIATIHLLCVTRVLPSHVLIAGNFFCYSSFPLFFSLFHSRLIRGYQCRVHWWHFDSLELAFCLSLSLSFIQLIRLFSLSIIITNGSLGELVWPAPVLWLLCPFLSFSFSLSIAFLFSPYSLCVSTLVKRSQLE